MSKFMERPQAKTSVSFEDKIIPVILITENALNKMHVYVDECKDEIGWLGTATHNREANEYTIEDVFLFKQEVHATTTEITPQGLEEFGMEILQLPDGMDIWNNIRMWGHSHVNMGITPSGQDDKQMKEFSQIGQPWFIRLIANKKGEMKVDLFHYAMGLYFLDVPWEMAESATESTTEELRFQIAQLQRQLEQETKAQIEAIKTPIVAEMAEKVKKKSHVTAYNNYNDRYAKDPIVTSHGRNRGFGWQTWALVPPTAQEMKDHKLLIPKYIQDEYNAKNAGKGESVGSEQQIIDLTDFDALENKQEVYKFFNERELYDLSFCKTIFDLEDEMEAYGYKDQFSKEDLRLIWEVVQAEADKFYDLDYWRTSGGLY